MRHLLLSTTLLIGWGLMGSHYVCAQGSEMYGKGMRFNLNEDGSKYMRFITWHQFWVRSIQNNPGTNVNGEPEVETWDIGLRRSRFLWYGQISPKFLILAHVGINNQTFVNGGGSGTTNTTGGYGAGKKPQIFFHDIWTEYTIVKNKLYIGTGLHYWNGISRMSSASTLNFMALDAPIFNWPLIEESDQFARQYGIYAKGKLGRVDYRIALNKPFSTPALPTALQPNRAISYNNNSWALAGYFAWEFFEKESNLLPFFVGTYIGTKKVLNLGAGFHYHPNATATLDDSNNTPRRHNMLLLGADLFLDMPLNKEKGTAITNYTVFYDYDFGPNYLRSIGIMNEGVMNPANGAIAQGAGNLSYKIGTGQIVYSELGYVLPKLKDGSKFQAFAHATYSNFKALAQDNTQYGAGFNYFMDGHHAKISLKYQTRPLYENVVPNGVDKPNLNPDRKRAGEWILQTMIYL